MVNLTRSFSSKTETNRIMGGVNVTVNKYPWVVSVQSKYGCRILGFKPRRVSTEFYSCWVAALRLVLRATLYIYVVNHLPYMYRINFFHKSYQAVNISELDERGFGLYILRAATFVKKVLYPREQF